MKVICLKQVEKVRGGTVIPIDPAWQIEVGSDYTVYDSYTDTNGTWYFLVGKPSYCAYKAELFGLLPEQTASELYEEEIEAIIM